MKTLRLLSIAAGFVMATACVASANDVTVAAGKTPAAAKATKTPVVPGCAASYKESEHAVNADKRWSYFKDTVREVSLQTDGSAWISFQKSSRRYLVPASEAALIASAKTSLDAKTPVHVAIEEGTESLSPADPPGKPAQLRWLDAKEQHPSCR